MLHSGCLHFGIRSAAVDAARLVFVDNTTYTRYWFRHSVETLEQFAFTFQKAIWFLRWHIMSAWMFYLQWASWPSFNLSGAYRVAGNVSSYNQLRFEPSVDAFMSPGATASTRGSLLDRNPMCYMGIHVSSLQAVAGNTFKFRFFLNLLILGVEGVLTGVGSELLDCGFGPMVSVLLSSVKKIDITNSAPKTDVFPLCDLCFWGVQLVHIPLDTYCPGVCAHAGNTDYLSVARANRLARRIAYLSLASHCWHEFGNVWDWIFLGCFSRMELTTQRPKVRVLVTSFAPFLKHVSEDCLLGGEGGSMGNWKSDFFPLVSVQVYPRHSVYILYMLVLKRVWKQFVLTSRSCKPWLHEAVCDLCCQFPALTAKKLIKNYRAKWVHVPLGAFGALTAKPVPCPSDPLYNLQLMRRRLHACCCPPCCALTCMSDK
jgi:hypothetical protein